MEEFHEKERRRWKEELVELKTKNIAAKDLQGNLTNAQTVAKMVRKIWSEEIYEATLMETGGVANAIEGGDLVILDNT